MQLGKKLQLIVCCMALVCAALAAGQTAKDQLLSQLSSAAAVGNLGLSQAVQRQMLTMAARQLNHRRKLQQPGPPEADCTPNLGDGGVPAAIQPLVTCAEPQCLASNKLFVQPDGTVVCRFTAPAGGTKIEGLTDVFGQFLDYDDVLWNTTGSSVLLGGSASTKTVSTNQLNTKAGSVGSTNNIKSTTDMAAIPNPLLGVASSLVNTLNVLTTTYGVDAKAPVTFTGKETTGFSTDSNYGSYLPGTVATAREVKDGGSDDNTVFPVRSFFG